jgi:carbon-monoxide dehydrogenase medium subunit
VIPSLDEIFGFDVDAPRDPVKMGLSFGVGHLRRLDASVAPCYHHLARFEGTMIKVPFASPTSVSEAVGLLAKTPGARTIAGGTDLLVRLKKGGSPPPLLVSLHAIDELRAVDASDDVLRLGAAVTLATLAESADIADEVPLLAAAAQSMASPPVRTRGTVGGNLCNASPAADLAPPLLVHEAEVIVIGPEGERRQPLSDFLVGPGQTTLKPGEILIAIDVPLLPPGTVTAHHKHQVGNCANLSIIALALAIRIDAQGTCIDARLALGAVAPTAIRSPEVERILLGSKLDAEVIARAAMVAGSQCNPIDDLRASCDHRCHLVSTLLPRAVQAALSSATNV